MSGIRCRELQKGLREGGFPRRATVNTLGEPCSWRFRAVSHFLREKLNELQDF